MDGWVCVCMYVCKYVFMYVCMYVCMYVNSYDKGVHVLCHGPPYKMVRLLIDKGVSISVCSVPVVNATYTFSTLLREYQLNDGSMGWLLMWSLIAIRPGRTLR